MTIYKAITPMEIITLEHPAEVTVNGVVPYFDENDILCARKEGICKVTYHRTFNDGTTKDYVSRETDEFPLVRAPFQLRDKYVVSAVIDVEVIDYEQEADRND